VEDQTSVEKASNVMLRGAPTGVEVEIKKGIMIGIGIGIGVETVICLESEIDLETVIRRERKYMTMHVVVIELGIISLVKIEIKTKI
jgi:hypothetical protein